MIIIGILSKTVIVKWAIRNKDNYESKGYIFTKYGDNVEIKIDDLLPFTKQKILYCCDGCNNEIEIAYNNYNKNKYGNFTYYCNKCSKIFGSNKSNENKLEYKKSKSFEDWCIEHSRQDILDRWDYKLNDFKPNEICCGSGKKIWFKCDKNKNHKSEQNSIGDFTSGHNGTMNCNQCNSFAQWGIDNLGDNFLELYWSNKNTLNPWEISYGSKKKIWIKCQEKDYHEDYEIAPTHFINCKRCPFCCYKKIHPKDSLGQYIVGNYGKDFLHSIWSDKNKKSAFEYAPNANKKVWWKCSNEKHEDYYRDINSSNNCDFRCPQCVQEQDESILQRKVRLYLETLNCTILHENKCTLIPKNPKTKQCLPFDNEIKELKLICEVNGRQHYEISGFHILSAKKNNTTPQQELHYQQLKDRYKRIKAIQNGYSYLEIPYWTDDEKESWKILILEQIKMK